MPVDNVASMLCNSIDMLRAYGVEPKTLKASPMVYKKLLPIMHNDKHGCPTAEINGVTLKIVLDSMTVQDGNYAMS